MKKGSVVILLAMAIILVATPWIIEIFAPYQEKIVEVPIKEEIEQAIKIPEIQDKFVEYKAIFLGGGGAGGQGGIIFLCDDANQFLELAGQEEIFLDFRLKKECFYKGPLGVKFCENTILEQIYMTRDYNPLAHNEEYRHQEDDKTFWIREYNPKAIVFVWNNPEEIWQWQIIFFVIVLILGLFSAFIYEKW